MSKITVEELVGYSLRVRAEKAEDLAAPDGRCELLLESPESVPSEGGARRVSLHTLIVPIPGDVRPTLALMLGGGDQALMHVADVDRTLEGVPTHSKRVCQQCGHIKEDGPCERFIDAESRDALIELAKDDCSAAIATVRGESDDRY